MHNGPFQKQSVNKTKARTIQILMEVQLFVTTCQVLDNKNT